jgi:hypothetical protein
MASSSEKLQILKMIENGSITAEEGKQLLDALGASREREEGGRGRARWVRVSVTDTTTGHRKATVNLPIQLVDFAIRFAQKFVPDSKDIDLEGLREVFSSGTVGRVFEFVDNDNGDRVDIFVE